NYDSIPLVVITGQVATDLIGNDAFQEVDIVGMTRNITKYSVTVKDREELGTILKKAFYIARTGKPGPVVVDLPTNIQTASGPSDYPKRVTIRGYKPCTSVHLGQLKKAYKLLEHAKRPLILAGGGVRISHAENLLKEFAEKTGVPVVTTLMGKGVLPAGHELYIGNSGKHGRYAANMAMAECDVLFSIGTRFNDRITGKLNEFASSAKIVHIDIDTASISRNVQVDVPVVSDATLALDSLLEWAAPMKTEKWRKHLGEYEEKYPLAMRRDRGISPQMVMEKINEIFPTGIVCADVGQNQMWAAQYIESDKDKPFITSGGLGTMGFGLPAAIGAKIACPDRDVICVTGDGGLQMNIQEMATAITEDAPVVICLLNNQYLGMVKQFQTLLYGKRYFGTCLRARSTCPKDCKGPSEDCPPYTPDFKALAESYGAYGIRVEKPEDIEEALKQARKHKDAPTLIEFIIASDELVLPMVNGNAPISDMIMR
nr:biosynthetic-type acetolactate synthase large subunit [Lachnospiraceae bacterium]